MLRRLLDMLDDAVRLLARTGLSENFIRFGIVGTMGFFWDTGTVYLLRHHVNLYVAGTCGFVVAATANWAANRLWTYRHQSHGALHVQWAKFVSANAVGFVFNRGVFFLLVSPFAAALLKSHIFANQPVYAIAAGSMAGLCFNYFLSKRFVFG